MRLVRALSVAAAFYAVAAQAQDPANTYPNNYKLLVDNAEFAVYRVHYGPHERVGVHDHSAYPTVYVYLNDGGPVRFTHEEAKPFTLVRPPTHKGAFRVSPGRVERHSVENLSDVPSDFVRIELKTISLGALKEEFRGHAPVPPLQDGTVVGYSAPQLRVERTICTDGNSCRIQPEHAASVVVFLDPCRDKAPASADVTASGTVVSLTEEQTLSCKASGAPVQILRVVVPQR